MAVLKKGSKGGPVAALQKGLNKKGASPKLKEDKIFGTLTDAALKKFQKKEKMKVDGIAGENTSFALNIGPKPKSLASDDRLKTLHDWLKKQENISKTTSELIKKNVQIFEGLIADTDGLKQILKQRSKTFSDRFGFLEKEATAARVAMAKTVAMLQKKSSAATSIGELKDIKDELEKSEKEYTASLAISRKESDVSKVKQTMKDLESYAKAVKDIKANVTKF